MPQITFNCIFQFHYGTIKSLEPHIMVGHFDQFQFHYGTIKSVRAEADKAEPTLFQFHYGTIKSKVIFQVVHSLGFISIPLWYD